MNMKKLIGVAALAAWSLTGSCGEPLRVALTFDDGLKDHLLVAAPLLEQHGWRGVFNIVIDRVGKDERHVTWDDVRELIRRGHEITTHTVTHTNLVTLLKSGREDLVHRELAVSRDVIAEKTGFTPLYLCTPYVAQNAETERIAREERLKQMLGCRHNFGAGNEDKVGKVVAQRLAAGEKRLDILHHGITAAGGGWRPFKDKAAFAHHLDLIAELEKEGKVVVTDYSGFVSDCALASKAWPHHGKD